MKKRTDEKKKMKKGIRGITLIALVVTIVVLLILAGVSLNLVFSNNGIISKAQKETLEARADSVETECDLWKAYNSLVENNNQGDTKSLADILNSLLDRNLITLEEKAEIESTGEVQIGSKTIVFNPYAKLTSISLDCGEKAGLINGKTGTINANVDNNEDGIEFIWDSSDKTVATINNGKVTGINNGETTISCKVKGKEDLVANCNLKVVDGKDIYALGVDGSKLSFKNIPDGCVLDIWKNYIGREETTYDCLQDEATYHAAGGNSDTDKSNAETWHYTDMFYMLNDSFGNKSKYFYFHVEQLCFKENTLVSTPNGLVAIQDIKEGDLVYSKNIEKDAVEIKRVLKKFKHDVDYKLTKIYTENSIIEATTGHKIYTKNKGWTKAYNIENGDMLLSQDNKEVIVKNVENMVKNEKVTVYNFEVEDNHNYFVGEERLLVHNPPESTCNIDGNVYKGEILNIE